MSGAALNAIVSPWFDHDRPKAIRLAFNGASVGGVLFTLLWSGLTAATGFRRGARGDVDQPRHTVRHRRPDLA
jgi:hypothetical protein